MQLRFVARDDSGSAWFYVQILHANSVIAAWTTRPRRVTGSEQALTWRLPAGSTPPLAFCLRAYDTGGHVTRPSCGRLRVQR